MLDPARDKNRNRQSPQEPPRPLLCDRGWVVYLGSRSRGWRPVGHTTISQKWEGKKEKMYAGKPGILLRLAYAIIITDPTVSVGCWYPPTVLTQGAAVGDEASLLR